MTNSLGDIQKSKAIIIFGANPAVNHPVGFQHFLKAQELNNSKLIVIDPRFTKTAAKADLYAQIRPGTDIPFMYGMLNIIFKNGWDDKEYVDARVFGMDKIREEADGGFFAQGTIYPDCIESGKGNADKIKTHHNKVAMPEDIKFDDVVEPLCDLFKDEVREVGRALGIEPHFLERHPFPGPGLAVRCLGELKKERLDVLREADAIFIEEIKKIGLYSDIWQAFCALLPVRSVGVVGDVRTYGETAALRAVSSLDAMTAEWVHLPYELLDTVSRRICNEVPAINRVVLDITGKPPATIEWE